MISKYDKYMKNLIMVTYCVIALIFAECVINLAYTENALLRK